MCPFVAADGDWGGARHFWMRDLKYANCDRNTYSTGAAVVSLDTARCHHMGSEHQPVSGSACLFATDVDLYSARPKRF